MDTRIAQFLQRIDRFTQRLDAFGADAWSQPSACEGWSAADVLDHIVNTQRDVFAERGVGLGPRPEGRPGEVWEAHAEAVRAAVADEDALLATYEGWFGPTTLADTLMAFYGFDLIVHAWDIAQAEGREVAFDDDELAFIEASIPVWGEALYMDGICKPAVDAGPGADRQGRLLASLGRLSGAR